MKKSKPPDPWITSQNGSMKKNKNAELKKSKKKCQQDTFSPDIKPKSTYESNKTETLFPRSQPNFETDSAIYSDSVVDDSDDSLETPDIEMDNLIIQDPKASAQQDLEIYQNSSGSKTQTVGLCSDPKLQAMGTEKPSLKATFQRNRVYPENTVPKHLAFTQDCPADKAVGTDETQNERQTSIVPQTNTLKQDCLVDDADEMIVENTARQRPISKEIPIGNQMQLERRGQQSYATNASGNSDLQYDGQRSVELPSSVRMAVESLATCSTGGMSDFVIIHTEEDQEAVYAYMDHLQQDIGINDLSVDLFGNINAGESKMKILAKLHDKFRHILIYVTTNLENDLYCQFQEEIVLSNGLKKGNGKEYRVVPVFTERGACEIEELSLLNGLKYFEFMSKEDYIKQNYVQRVKNLVHEGRQKLP